MDAKTPIEIELPRGMNAPSQARRLLEDRFAAVLDPSELDAAKQLASELVNNAVLHGRGKITFRMAVDGNRVLIEVSDEGSGFERILHQQDFERIGGRGLDIVEAASSRWGVHEGTTHVWVELERAGPRIGADSKPPLSE